MSQEHTDSTGDDRLFPSSDHEQDAPSLGRYYDDAAKELGPDALHFDVVKRALDLWEDDVKGHERPPRKAPGKDAD